jgi:hypothetical protein
MAEKHIYVSTTDTIPELAGEELVVVASDFISSIGCHGTGEAIGDLLDRCLKANYDAVIGVRITVDSTVWGHFINGDGKIDTTPYFTAYGTGIRWKK